MTERRRDPPPRGLARLWCLSQGALVCLLLLSACAGHHPRFKTPREARIYEYLRSYPDTSPGRLSLMETCYVFRGMTLAQFQAVVGFRPAEEMTLEAQPRHIVNISYQSQGDESTALKDSFLFVDGGLYSWDIKSFSPEPPETPLMPREYAGQK